MSEWKSGNGHGAKVNGQKEIAAKKAAREKGSAKPEAGIENKENANGRDEKGRFAKGNHGGPGNPFARKVAEFRTVIMEAVSNEDMKVIVQALVEKAKKGDVAAAKVVMSYTAGKPESAVNPDRLDLEEWKLYEQNPKPDGVPQVLFGTVPMDPLIAFARGGVWAQSQRIGDGFLEEVRVGAEREKMDSPQSHRGHREKSEDKDRYRTGETGWVGDFVSGTTRKNRLLRARLFEALGTCAALLEGKRLLGRGLLQAGFAVADGAEEISAYPWSENEGAGLQ